MYKSVLNRNHYFVIGLIVGLLLSSYIPQNIWELVQREECPQQDEYSYIEKFGQEFEPHLNLINKPLAAKKPVKNVIRPRYYSSELGIREKIFIGVMSSQNNINTLATAINRTTAHLVNKIKFFINADNVKTNYKLKNIVGFTDTRDNLRPFHVIKYIADNYLDDYDYFLIIPDSVYVDARKIKQMLYHFSITFDLYMGNKLNINFRGYGDINYDADTGADAELNRKGGSNDDFKMLSDRNYCDLNAGILLSSSVIRKINNNLDWCVRNGVTNIHSVNIGRCVKYSSNLAGCQESFQGIQHQSFVFKPYDQLYKDLNVLSKDESFRNASVIYPVTSAYDFYRLHAYFSKHHWELAQQRSSDFEHKSYDIANGSISNNLLEIHWPLGVSEVSIPETRHDILTWNLVNETHIFLPNSENVIDTLDHISSTDLKKVLEVTLQYAAYKYPDLQYTELHTAYKKFDPTRGMDYQLHLKFQNSLKEKDIMKSFRILKPIGRVEVVPSPYVTESTRIAILVPTFEHQVNDAIDFIMQYERVCMRNQDNTFLLMIFLYRYDSSSKGEADPFKSIKTLALDLTTKYKNDGSRVAWVSIRLPSILSDPMLPEDFMINSIYARNEILSIAIADLALPKIGLESLILMATTSTNFRADFLNRVRMNTISGFQVYSPIGFTMYPCNLAHFCKECTTCDISQSTGYFDKWNYDVISFYSHDYVQARKAIEPYLSITRSDNDIELLLTRAGKSINTILDIFVSSQLPVHILRGVEPSLHYSSAIKNYINDKNEIPTCILGDTVHNIENSLNNNVNKHSEIPLRYERYRNSEDRYNSRSSKNHKCIRLASRKHIGDAIIRHEDKSILHK